LRETRYDATLVMLLKNRQSTNQDLPPTKGQTCYAILSCLLRVTCFPTVLLKNYFQMLVHTLVWPWPYWPYRFRRPWKLVSGYVLEYFPASL